MKITREQFDATPHDPAVTYEMFLEAANVQTTNIPLPAGLGHLAVPTEALNSTREQVRSWSAMQRWNAKRSVEAAIYQATTAGRDPFANKESADNFFADMLLLTALTEAGR